MVEIGGTFVGVGSVVAFFGANGFVSGAAPYHIFKLPPTNRDNATSLRVDKPGLYFMGSFKLVLHGRRFELVRVDAPTEQDVLKMLLYRNRVSFWKPTIKRRQADLAAAGRHDKRKLSRSRELTCFTLIRRRTS